ncbi:MAG TPA: branched-chain amino acid ABC transporter permease, partial [Variovorax sp.]|nr:branched-chain amino acid ABC transporter permease [Variovorax sp.]
MSAGSKLSSIVPGAVALALALLAPTLSPYLSDFVVKIMILSIFALSLELLV